MALIQRFVLFLGHPTYALTVVVFLMLLSSGAGSVASKHWLQETASVRRVLVAIAGVVMVYVALLHRLLGSLVALPFIGKLLLSALLLVPLGFLMGMPFPTGLRAMATAEQRPQLVGLGPECRRRPRFGGCHCGFDKLRAGCDLRVCRGCLLVGYGPEPLLESAVGRPSLYREPRACSFNAGLKMRSNGPLRAVQTP
jgi:hypothetical protein